MELWAEKILSSLTFFIVPIIIGLILPYFLLRESVRTGVLPPWFKFVNSISTGLLFGVTLLHLITDCTEDFEEALEEYGKF